MSGMHFERMAADYAAARPPYPRGIYRTLLSEGVIGRGRRVLEIGAGAGLATAELVRAGSEVVAIEPGPRLVDELRRVAPGVEVVGARLEDADIPDGSFDSVVAAMSMHWVDLSVGLPKVHSALRPGGWLAVWRTIFGDETVDTEFRRRVRLVASRRNAERSRAGRPAPAIGDLAADGLFEPVTTERWQWSVDLTTEQVRRLFLTFSNWTRPEVDEVAEAADDLGGVVTEHYQSVLDLLRRD